MMVLPIVYADTTFIKKDTTTNIKFSCFDSDNNFCDNNTNCTITITNPSFNIIVNNKNMTYNPSYFNYTISGENLSKLGDYNGIMQCKGTSESGKVPIPLKVTLSGNDISAAETANNLPIIIGMIIAIIYFGIIGFLTKFEKIKSALFGIKFLSYGITLIEIVFLMFIIYAFNSEVYLTNLLRVNFYIMLFVGMGIGFVSIYLNAFSFVNLAKKETKDKWDENKWQ